MASPLSLELLPSHLQRAQLHTGVVLGWSRAEGGWGGALASPPLTCGRCSWVLGAGARGSMDSSEARRDRPECGRRCERGCSAQRRAPARDALAIRPALRSPAEALWPRGGGLRCSPPGLGTSSPPPAVPQRPAPVFERTKPRPRPAAFSQPGTLLSSGLRLDPGSCHLLRPCGVGCGRGGGAQLVTESLSLPPPNSSNAEWAHKGESCAKVTREK